MSGVIIGSGLYQVYTLRTGRDGAIDLDGHKTNLDAIVALTRRVVSHLMDPGAVDAMEDTIIEAVKEVFTARRKDDEQDFLIEEARAKQERDHGD